MIYFYFNFKLFYMQYLSTWHMHDCWVMSNFFALASMVTLLRDCLCSCCNFLQCWSESSHKWL